MAMPMQSTAPDPAPVLVVPAAPGAAWATPVYAQRLLPASPLMALVASPRRPLAPPHALRHRAAGSRTAPPASPPPPCLRKISAYQGGFRSEEELTPASSDERRRALRKKRLSFADQHGRQLTLEREFSTLEAPIFCNHHLVAAVRQVTNGLPDAHAKGVAGTLCRLLRGHADRDDDGGVGGGWSQQELVSLCLLSCSIVGCVVFGLRQVCK